MRFLGGVNLMPEWRQAFLWICRWGARAVREGGRECLRTPYRESDARQIAGFVCVCVCDAVRAGMGRRDGKIRPAWERAEMAVWAPGCIFMPLTRHDDCWPPPVALQTHTKPRPSPKCPGFFQPHLHVKAMEGTVQISMRWHNDVMN